MNQDLAYRLEEIEPMFLQPYMVPLAFSPSLNNALDLALNKLDRVNRSGAAVYESVDYIQLYYTYLDGIVMIYEQKERMKEEYLSFIKGLKLA
ncbi:hypothetical protein [Pontibacillus halophilus]|uniref:hypothetical protein n=1 Tax=Pontibacillus halophilus TaxID=516704 RepID=UPI000427E6A4|nr:hypothetical protein [Pontibacillus halophilus]